MDSNLFEVEMIIFVNDTVNNTTIFVADRSNLALDNVNITISDPNSAKSNIILSAINGNIQLIDSYIMDGYDILYNNDSCNLIQNNRIRNTPQYIASLLISCLSADQAYLHSTMNIDPNSGSMSTLNTSMIKTPLILSNTTLSLNVTGCPIMYGPSPSNYTCIPCNTDYFNMNQFNVEH